MSFCYHYYFRSDATLDELASQFNNTFSANLAPTADDPTVYEGRLFATGYTLTHNFVSESLPELNDYPYSLTATIWAPENDLLYIHPALFFSTIYLMYTRLKITQGVWVSDSFTTIARYDYVCRDTGWNWYDLTNDCIAGYEDQHVEDYMMRVFPRDANAG